MGPHIRTFKGNDDDIDQPIAFDLSGVGIGQRIVLYDAYRRPPTNPGQTHCSGGTVAERHSGDARQVQDPPSTT